VRTDWAGKLLAARYASSLIFYTIFSEVIDYQHVAVLKMV
jgi:hypothetical protein